MDRISGPILDRIDLHVEVEAVNFDQLSSKRKEETSAEIRARVEKARAIQRKRFEGTGITCNAKMSPKMTKDYCLLTKEANDLLKAAFEKLDLSARAYNKILRISRKYWRNEE